jgi:hypothetical protein
MPSRPRPLILKQIVVPGWADEVHSRTALSRLDSCETEKGSVDLLSGTRIGKRVALLQHRADRNKREPDDCGK